MSYRGQVRDGVTSVLGRCGSGRLANQARRSDHSDASVVQRCSRVGLCPQPLVTRAQHPRDGGFASAHEGAWPCGARPRAAPGYRREENFVERVDLSMRPLRTRMVGGVGAGS